MFEYYLVVKVVHIVFFIAWMAGLVYVPRLFVYHSENMDNKGFTKVVKVQERKLLYIITLPSMYLTLFSGLFMLHLSSAFLSQPWMILKLILIVVLIGYTHSLKSFYKKFKKNICKRSTKFFRIYNEVPTITMIFIVILVVIKPSF